MQAAQGADVPETGTARMHTSHEPRPALRPALFTYRTARILMAIAERPSASNRPIADTAEIRDQGRVSKLLRRSRRAGMVSNTGLGPGKGALNAWTLTGKGPEDHRRDQSSHRRLAAKGRGAVKAFKHITPVREEPPHV
jgi:hypothetical protein